jgi:hypothetical protein
MRKPLQTAFLTVFLLLLGVSTVPAQTFEIEADSTDLTPASGDTDTQCLVQRSTGELVFYNSVDGGIFSWNGTDLTEERSSDDVNSDIADESNTIDRCDGVTVDANDNVYFLLRSNESSSENSWPTFVYKLPPSDAPSVLASEDGLQGVTHDDGTVYLTGVSFRGAPADGFFSINDSDEGQAPTEIVSDSNLDLNYGIDVSESGNLYAFSGGFGGGNFEQKIVRVIDLVGAATLEEFVDPYRDGSPLIPDSGNDIEDLDIVTHEGTEFIVVYNGSFQADDGDQWATIQISDQSIDLLFNRTQLVDNLPVDGYVSGYSRPMTVNSEGEVFAASRTLNDATDYIAKVSDAPPLPVEMAGFDAVHNGSSVELTWQTASETNNAGFTVQRETESGWTSLDFVESKVAGGTTTETSYRYRVDQELDPGTHRFRLQQKDLDGSTSLSDAVTVEIGLNEALTLQSPMPNPTRTQATVEFGVKEATETSVAVYNVLGQRVKTLYQGTPQANQMRDVTFNAGSLSSGVYFVRMQADGQTRTERLTVVR